MKLGNQQVKLSRLGKVLKKYSEEGNKHPYLERLSLPSRSFNKDPDPGKWRQFNRDPH